MEALRFFVYYSHQHISRLYRQLPDSRLSGQRASLNQHDRADTGMRLHHREEEERPRLSHVGVEGSLSSFKEACFEKNDMYQLEQVLRRLRASGQLYAAGHPTPAEGICQGDYLEIRGCFLPERKRETPEGSLWLVTEECRPAIRLLCGRQAFCGETEEAWQELWACGDPLPLRGVMLCLAARADCLCGLPLFLAI